MIEGDTLSVAFFFNRAWGSDDSVQLAMMEATIARRTQEEPGAPEGGDSGKG